MRLFFIVLFLGAWNLNFSQNYKFNSHTKYVINQEGKKRERVVFSNADNQSYFLTFEKTPRENLASITDLKNSKIHDLTFTEKEEEGALSLEFKHIKTRELQPFNLYPDFQFGFETISQDSLYKTVKMTVYKNKKRKKVMGISELKIKKYSKNLFPVFRYSYLHLFEYRTDVDLGENGIVESCKSIGDGQFECHLAYCDVIDLLIKIPNLK